MKLFFCAGGIGLTYALFPDSVTLTHGIFSVFAAATVLMLCNLFIKPVFQIIALLPSMLTLGIATLFANTFVVCIADAIVPIFKLENFWLCMLCAAFISFFNVILNSLSRSKKVSG